MCQEFLEHTVTTLSDFKNNFSAVIVKQGDDLKNIKTINWSPFYNKYAIVVLAYVVTADPRGIMAN